jgi:hypothetical protein
MFMLWISLFQNDSFAEKGDIFTDFGVEYDCEVYNRNTRRVVFSKYVCRY